MRLIAVTIGAILPASLWAGSTTEISGPGSITLFRRTLTPTGGPGTHARPGGQIFADRADGFNGEEDGFGRKLGFPVARARFCAGRAGQALNHCHRYPCGRVDAGPDPGQPQPAARSRRGAGAREGMAARLLEASAAAV